MNKVILKGRLTKDPIFNERSENKKSYARFCLAVPRMNGETDFINCYAFSKTAEFIGEYFKKGQEMLIEGNIRYRFVEEELHVDVIAEKCEFCGSKKDNEATKEEDDYPL